MLPPLTAVWVATLAQTYHFSFWKKKKKVELGARWKAPVSVGGSERPREAGEAGMGPGSDLGILLLIQVAAVLAILLVHTPDQTPTHSSSCPENKFEQLPPKAPCHPASPCYCNKVFLSSHDFLSWPGGCTQCVSLTSASSGCFTTLLRMHVCGVQYPHS